MSKIKLKKILKRRLKAREKSFLLVFILCLTSSLSVFSQGSIISGTITSSNGQGLPGANIVQKGTVNGTVTDFDGNYNLTLLDGEQSILVFSYIGFQSQEQNVGITNRVDVTLIEDSESLADVVVIGYGTTDRKNILGSVSSVKEEEVSQITPVNTFDAIQGRLAGVQIASNGGPGQTSDIKIRGTSTFNGGTGPLYVVDGQQLEDIDNLDPNDIASLEVLKDGASAAIYGSKSANGVIIITTKSGKTGKFNVTANQSTTLSFVNRFIPVSNTRERVLFEQRRANESGTGVDADSLSTLYQQTNDLQKLITRAAIRNQTNIALSGGSDKIKFYWNNGFLNEEGVVINTFFKRVTTNLKLNTQFNDKLSSSTIINGSYDERNGLNENSVLGQLSQRPAYLPVYNSDGSLFPEAFGRQNPVAEALKTKLQDRNFRSRMFNELKYQITPSLSFKTTLGLNFRLRRRNNFNPTIVLKVGTPPTASERTSLDYDIQQENFFNYEKNFGYHNLSGLLGMQTQKWRNEFSEINALELASDEVETLNNSQLLNSTRTFTDATRHSLLSYFGRIAYDYKGKYLLAGTLRRDGSSRFGENTKFGNFPSASVGWRASSEKFMKPLAKVVSDLKFRAGYAITGNERIGNYESLYLFRPGFFYDGINGSAPVQLANNELSWESTTQINGGVDLSLFNGRLDITADYYEKTTDDLLYDVPLPEETGFTSIRQNIGSVENKGYELFISGSPIKTDNFEWFTSFNIAYNENTVIELENPEGFDTNQFRIEEGQPLGNIIGFTNLGVFAYDESNAFTPAANGAQQLTLQTNPDGSIVTVNGAPSYTLNGNPYTGPIERLTVNGSPIGGGDIIWKDLNGDLNIDSVNDREVIGNGLPEFYGGLFNELKYKNFSFSFLFDYSFGNDIYRRYDFTRNHNSSGATPSPERINNAWVKPGDIAEFPTLLDGRAQNRIGVSSQYLSSGDFVKLRNIRMNYTFPKDFLKKISWLNAFSVNMSVNNLATWTRYTGYNPELGSRGNALEPGIDNLRYPSKTDIIFGVRAKF